MAPSPRPPSSVPLTLPPGGGALSPSDGDVAQLVWLLPPCLVAKPEKELLLECTVLGVSPCRGQLGDDCGGRETLISIFKNLQVPHGHPPTSLLPALSRGRPQAETPGWSPPTGPWPGTGTTLSSSSGRSFSSQRTPPPPPLKAVPAAERQGGSQQLTPQRPMSLACGTGDRRCHMRSRPLNTRLRVIRLDVTRTQGGRGAWSQPAKTVVCPAGQEPRLQVTGLLTPTQKEATCLSAEPALPGRVPSLFPEGSACFPGVEHGATFKARRLQRVRATLRRGQLPGCRLGFSKLSHE
uniref:Uncharacterized protein LOC123619646 n=1 Tax=Camelus bactrianus TaxID=9837 RepID=A0A9W3HQ40_CAMBA|nr:uncharacterized protein LOC123619646 [Camelus bactrianus]